MPSKVVVIAIQQSRTFPISEGFRVPGIAFVEERKSFWPTLQVHRSFLVPMNSFCLRFRFKGIKEGFFSPHSPSLPYYSQAKAEPSYCENGTPLLPTNLRAGQSPCLTEREGCTF